MSISTMTQMTPKFNPAWIIDSSKTYSIIFGDSLYFEFSLLNVTANTIVRTTIEFIQPIHIKECRDTAFTCGDYFSGIVWNTTWRGTLFPESFWGSFFFLIQMWIM